MSDKVRQTQSEAFGLLTILRQPILGPRLRLRLRLRISSQMILAQRHKLQLAACAWVPPPLYTAMTVPAPANERDAVGCLFNRVPLNSCSAAAAVVDTRHLSILLGSRRLPG